MKILKNKIEIEKNHSVINNGIIGAVCLSIILLIVFWCNKKPVYVKAQLIITIAVIIVLVLNLVCYTLFDITFHRWAFLFIMSVGCLSLMIQPILNIPDEPTHLARAELVSEGCIFVSTDINEYSSIQAVSDLSQYSGRAFTQTDLEGKKINYSKTKVYNVAASNLSFLYIPQAIGVLIAKILHLNVIWILWLGRFFNLLVYSLLVSLSIKIATKWKFVLFFAACLPMSIQQAASFSPDALINGLSFLAIGYFICLYIRQEISLREYGLFCLLCIILPLAKITNIFITGLVLILPMKNVTHPKRFFMKWGLLLVVAIVGGGYYLYTTKFPVSLEQYDYLTGMNVNFAKQLEYIFNNVSEWGRNFVYSSVNQVNSLISMLCSFGWLEYDYSIINVLGFIGFVRVCSQEKSIGIKKMDRALIVLICVCIYMFTCFALYLSWTTVGSSEILGLQGRYLIPMIGVGSLLLGVNRIYKDKESYVIDLVMLMAMIGMMFIVTAVRYY